MDSNEYRNVVDNMMIGEDSIWTLPITLDVDSETFAKAASGEKLYLAHNGREVGFVEIADCYKIDAENDVKKIFGTDDINHPGVKKELDRFLYRIGGRTEITDKSILENSLDPKRIKEIFARNNWKTIVGFHTRNAVHRAHEYLQRIGLEICDGLFINPIGGWKKSGDFTNEAIVKSYQTMIDNYYPKDRVYLELLKTSVRYAGPREAIFTAIIRRNLGCTHFIIGRDHTGVGSYYGKYEAHELARELMKKGKLGIELLLLKGPYFCTKCNHIATENTCSHGEEYIIQVSGTKIRELISKGERPDERLLRPEVADVLIALKDKFVK